MRNFRESPTLSDCLRTQTAFPTKAPKPPGGTESEKGNEARVEENEEERKRGGGKIRATFQTRCHETLDHDGDDHDDDHEDHEDNDDDNNYDDGRN